MSLNLTTNVNDFRSTGSSSEQTTYTASTPTTPGLNAGDTAFISASAPAFSTTPSSAFRYRSTDGKWYKYPGVTATPVYPALQPVIDMLATPPATLRDQDSYIVKATATGLWTGKEGQIATYSNELTGWVFYTPQDSDRTTLTSSGSVTGTGTYEYDSATSTWTLIEAGINTTPPDARPTYGNYALVTEYHHSSATAVDPVIVNGSVVAWGFEPSSDSANNIINNAGDGMNTFGLPHKIPFAWTNLIDGTYAPVSQYVPNFVDAASMRRLTLAIDQFGKVWAHATLVQGTGITTTVNGTTAVANAPLHSFVPIPFFHGNNIQAYQVGVTNQSQATSNISSWVLSVTGDLYVTGYNANGQMGDGSTTARTNWFKWAGLDPIKKVYMNERSTYALTTTNKLYYAGADGNAAFFGTGQKTTPFLAATGIADFDVGVSQNIIAVKTDGTLWAGGDNSQGQLGRNNVTNTTFSQVPGITNAKTPLAPDNRPALGYIGTDNKLYVAGYNEYGRLAITGLAINGQQRTFKAVDAGTVSFQGAIKKVRMGNTTIVVMDTSGNLYQSGSPASRGIGNNDFNTLTALMNTFTQVPLPEPATDFRVVDLSSDYTVALCGAHGFYGWGWSPANYAGWISGQNYHYSPTYVPTGKMDNGIPVSAAPRYIA